MVIGRKNKEKNMSNQQEVSFLSFPEPVVSLPKTQNKYGKLPALPRTKTIFSISKSNYRADAAIGDLVDNSIDASASEIVVYVRTRDKKHQIIIADDGSGMDYENLHEALLLGSETFKDGASLGKFGMGLITSSLSLGEKLCVITKKQDEELLMGVLDPKEIMKQRDWFITINEADKEATSLFEEILPKKKSGTIVFITSIHSSVSVQGLRDDLLPKYLGRTFRYFLTPITDREKNSGKIKIFVGADNKNRKEIFGIDPLEKDWKGTKILHDKELEIEYIDEEGKTKNDTIKIKFTEIENGVVGNPNRQLDANIRNQGIYVVRNKREIMMASDFFGIWPAKNNEYNYGRCEICFSEDLDEVFNLTYDKTNLKHVAQSILDKIRETIAGYITSIRNRAKERSKTSAGKKNEEVFKKVQMDIAKKKQLLDLPPATKHTRGPKENPGEEKTEPKEDGTKHKNGKSPSKKLADLCRFETGDFGTAGQLFSLDKENDVIVVKWNVAHPFYQKFVDCENNDEKTSQEYAVALNYFVYSFAAAQMKYMIGDDDHTMSVNVLESISSNLRAILS